MKLSYLDCYIGVLHKLQLSNLDCYVSVLLMNCYVSIQCKSVFSLGLGQCLMYQMIQYLSSCLLICIVTLISCKFSCDIATVTVVSRANLAVFVFGLLRLYLTQTYLSSYLGCYVSISRKFSCYIRILTLICRLNLAVEFGLLHQYLAKIQLSYLNCYVNISRKLSCVRIWIVTLVSNLAVFVVGLLCQYLA